MHNPDPAAASFASRRLPLRLLLASLAAALALLAAGCGGPSPEERFAESVCSTTLPWAQKMLKTYEITRLIRAAPGADSVVALNQGALIGKSNAKGFGLELRAIPVPETEAGREAKRWLEHSARESLEFMAEEVRHVRRLRLNITLLQSIRELQRLELALVRAFAMMATTAGNIQEFVPELKEPFEKADSCTELEALGTD